MAKITGHRIKTEWWKLFVLLAFAVFYLWNITSQIPSVKYDTFVRNYGDVSVDNAASALGVEGGADMYEVYEKYISSNREFFYTKPIDNSVAAVILMGLFLAVLLLCGLFGNRSVSAYLQSGCGKGSLFLSMTAAYYLAAIAIWLAVTSLVRFNYSVVFSAGERGYFLTTYLSWLLMVLATVSIPYLAAFIFHHALPTVLVSLGVMILLHTVLPKWMFPTGVMVRNEYWRFDADMSLLIRADFIAAGMIIAAIVVSYVCFRRKGQK